MPEQRRFVIGRPSRAAASGKVLLQCLDCARMERYLTGLEKLCHFSRLKPNCFYF